MKAAVAAVVLLCAPAFSQAFPDPGPRDWLWHMVSECLDPSAPGYCARCKRPIDGACGPRACAESIAVWDVSRDYAALRDRKMCGCPEGFVHGLALPRTPVKGVEDPARPAGLFEYAWRAARSRIPDEGEILLAVNGPQRRTQDQLHAHILRLLPEGRKLLEKAKPEEAGSLGEVWAAAARHARRQGLTGWYGVAVARGGKGWLAAASADGHPETEYGQPFCKP